MKPSVKIKILVWLSVMIACTATYNKAYASHSEGADLTYKCLGGNQYQLTLSFYRDCHGVAAPINAVINCFSPSTNQNFNMTLQPIPGTGQEISVVCSSLLTECQGGIYPGVQEWVYKGTTTLSPAVDWIFSFDLCCRNAAITTIVNPGAQNIHIESTLNNLDFPCNSSPVFTTKPVPFVCLNQNYTFNHGAFDPDGDLITYELVTPMNAANSYVTYFFPYTATQPLTSSPLMTFDTLTGDINMNPTMLEVTVLAVKVKQWRNNRLVGYVIRDIQLRTINCNNSYPYIDGISGTWAFITNACVGSNLTFYIYTHDADPNQTITLSWNNIISGATFTIAGGQNPIGTFSWTPTINDTGTHCFTVTVTDNNCPINGSQTFSLCLVVSGINVSIATTSANCGANNGTAVATISGGVPPYTYHWMPCGCTQTAISGLTSGTYTAIVTDGKGCTGTNTGTVNNGTVSGNVNINFTPASCFGGNDGSANANANGGQSPYTYLWSNGETTQTITGLAAGNYYVSVTTASGCVTVDSVTVNQPSQLNVAVTQNDASCFGMSNGSASVSSSGGTPPYFYQWNNGQTISSVTGLSAGNYFITTTDSKGCKEIQNVTINQPSPVVLSIFSLSNVSCFGGNNGTATAIAYGGVNPYSYLWNTMPTQTTQTAIGLSSGNYIVTVLDSSGCSMMVPVNITEPAPISSTINSVNANCYGSSTGTVAAAATGGSPPYSYLWSNGQTIYSATNLAAGNYSVLITDQNGCSHVDAATISQPTLLSAAITNVQNVSCNKKLDGSATANATGGTSSYTYQWSNGQTTSTATALGSGYYSVIITDANGCSAMAAVSITQPTAVIVSINAGDTICPGQNTIITADASGGINPYTYFWQPNVGFGNSQIVNPVSTTTYTAIVTDANGCTTTGVVLISVFPMNIALTVNATPGICIGQSATISASVTGNNISSYYWSNNLGNGAGPYAVSPTTTTTYSVTVTNVCGATTTSAATVIVHPLPQIDLTPQTVVACDRATLHFSDTNSANSGSTYAWNFGDGFTSLQANPSHTYMETGEFVVMVTVTSPYGCTSSAQAYYTLGITPSPSAAFTSDPQMETNMIDPTFHFYDQSTHADQWNWDFGDGNTSTLKNPMHTYAAKGIYTVKLVTLNSGGCIDSIIKTIEVKPEFTFYIPNTFTPNGDNDNETFSGKGQEIIEYEMLIFDRWGNKIFQTNDLNTGWDGRANGGTEIAQEDVYVYEINLKDFTGKAHFYAGNVNLIK